MQKMMQFPEEARDIPQITEKPMTNQQGGPKSYEKHNQSDTNWINDFLTKV
jgi:hypothetical protein